METMSEDGGGGDYPSARGSSRYQLYQAPSVKMCYFMPDGNPNVRPYKVAINQRYFRSMDVLERELSKKVKDLPFGCRSIFTPGGSHQVKAVEDLQDEGRYVCSTHRSYAHGVDLTKVKPHIWHGAGKPSSGRRSYINTLRNDDNVQVFRPRKPKGDRRPRGEDSTLYATRAPKKVLLIRNGDPSQRHVVLLNRRTAQTFEQVLEDLSSMFGFQVRKLFTIEGRRCRGLSGIFNGPDTFVVSGPERFKTMSSAQSDPGPAPNKTSYTTNRSSVNSRLKSKREKLARTKGKWKTTITTNELPSAGTHAQVTLTVYGHKGNSGPIPLGHADGQTFQAGHIDEFDISVGNIGEIFKVRIAHDNNGEFPSWFCDEVRMKDEDTGEELVFLCGRWLSRDEDDGEICRELPAVREGEPILPVHKYELSVVTGDLWNAGTNANVYVTIYGERGDTGVRQLIKQKPPKPFTKGQTDIFTVEAVSLGRLKRVIVGHDGTGSGYGWFLDYIAVKESSRHADQHIFPCNRWLDEGEDDGKIVRELKRKEEYTLDQMEKQLFELQKWKFEPHSQVVIVSKATQKCLRIKPDATVDALADPNDPLAVFNIIPRKGNVRILQSAYNNKYHIAIDSNKTLGQGRGGAYCELKVRVQPDHSVMFESVKYMSQHLTIMQSGAAGDPRGAIGTPTKEFFVHVKGMFREEGIVMIGTSMSQVLNIDHDNTVYATGRKNRLSQFKVHKVEEGVRMFESMVFPGQFIRLKDGQVDCQGTGDQFCQFKVEKTKEQGFVTLQSTVSRGIYLGMTPEGKVRPTVNTGDKNVRFYPEIIEYGRPKDGKPTPREPTPPPTKPKKVKRKASPPPPAPVISPREEKEEKQKRPASPKYEKGDWKVWITTEEAAKYCEVVLVVYGNKGNSGPIHLGAGGQGGLFLAGHRDEFKVNLRKVGKVFKIRLELIPKSTKKEPVWKVQEVKMQDMNNQDTLKFKINRWLSQQEDDQDIMRESPAVWPGEEVLPVLHYVVMVYTGNKPGADTDANVFLCMAGELGDTGKRHLICSDQSKMFQEGQVDTFELEAVSLGDLKTCIVSHDGKGKGEGWYCEKIVVRESREATEEYVFPCNKWLDSGLDDKKTERVLKVQEGKDKTPSPEPAIQPEEEEEEKAKDGDWIVWVTTGPQKDMSTDEEVILYAYGDKNQSGPITLGSGKEGVYFGTGATDEFKVNLGENLGNLYKIRIGHKEEERQSDWYVEKVKMKNLVTQELLTFKVNQWMSRNQDDMDVWRELPVTRPGVKPLPVRTYVIEVHTGTEPGADTEADIYINMYGKRGDSGVRRLYRSKSGNTMFQEGQMDVFELQAVDLDDLEKIVIGHNDTSPGAGWFLDKVFIKEGHEPSDKQYYFPCGHWFDKGQDDQLIEREIAAQEPPADSRGEYKVTIITEKDSHPAKGMQAVITLYGSKGKSQDFPLGKDKKCFEPGATDEFEIAAGDIGELYKIRIGQEDKYHSKHAWHLDNVTLQDKDTGQEFPFVFDRWLDRGRDDYDIVRELAVSDKGKPRHQVQVYEVEVHTGDHWAAETDANVYMTLYGSQGDTGKRWLYQTQDTQEKHRRGQTDTFLLEAVTLEDLQRLVIGHDGKGYGAGWFLEKVVIRERHGDRSHMEFVFPCGRWMDDHEDDRKTERELFLMDVVDTKEETQSTKSEAKTQGDWIVKVKTSDRHNAGTHAQVYITVYGDKGNSGRKELGKADQNSDQFDRNKESEFKINVGDIGDIFKIRMEHDNQHPFPAWHLEKVVMQDAHTGQEHKFFVDRWLATDEEDGQLIREFPVPTKDTMPLPILRYYIAIHTAKQKEAGTLADAFITLCGELGDSGRHPLAESKTNNNAFQPGQVDVFFVEAVALGRIHKVIIEHSGKTKDDAWLVEKVLVKEAEYALSELLFPCNQWLEYVQGQPAQRELICSGANVAEPNPEFLGASFRQEEPTKGEWQIWATTGSHDDIPPLEAPVYITVCGTRGETNMLPLEPPKEEEEAPIRQKPVRGRQGSISKQPSKAKVHPKAIPRQQAKPIFQPGTTDDFKINTGDIGSIYKIRLTIRGSSTAAWNLIKLKMKDTTTGQEFHFPHSGWIKASKGNPQAITEMPAIRPDLMPLQDAKYILTVKTGTQPRSETSANVSCKLIGEWGDTGKRPLIVSQKNETNFQNGQTDVFEVEALEVGKVKQIWMGHDGIGRGRGWYLELVTLRTEEQEDHETVFPCHRWLDTGCNDRKLECILHPFADIPLGKLEEKPKLETKGEWQCWVTTATDLADVADDQKRAGPVSITVYGEQGVSGPTPLNNHEEDMFTPGKTDQFDLQVGKIGEITKIRICCGSDDDDESIWTVQKVVLQDVHTKEKLDFDFSRWAGEKNGDIRKELPAVRDDRDIPEVVPYQLKTNTGENDDSNEDDGGNANNNNNRSGKQEGDEPSDNEGEEEPGPPEVYITVYGSRGDTGPRRLKNTQEGFTPFQPGQEDTFTIEAVDLGDIEKVVVTKKSGPAWNLKTISIKRGPYDATESVIKCDSVIENTSPDAPAEVSLNVTETKPSQVALPVPDAEQDPAVQVPKSKGNWKLHTRTGSEKGAGTTSQVVVVMVGSQGETSPVPLKPKGKTKPFQEGATDEFEVNIPAHIGEITKVRFGFADQMDHSSWFVEDVKFQDMDAYDEFTLEIHDWLEITDQKDGWKEIPVLWPGLQVPQVLNYQLEVYTGDRSKAATSANVYVIIKGSQGSSGRRLLKKKSQNNDTAFEQGQMDIFHIEASYLGTPELITIGHDGTGAGSGWFLDKVVLKEGPEANKEYLFECDKWLDAGEDDRKIERKLIPSGAPTEKPPGEPWKVTIQTGQTTSSVPVKLVIYGQKDKSDEILLGQEEPKFQARQTDTFEELVKANLGAVYKIRLGLESDQKASWDLQKVELENQKSGESYSFSYDKTLELHETSDSWLELPVATDKPEEQLQVKTYEVEVYTGDENNASTSANVYMEVVGEHGDTGHRKLLKAANHDKNKFQQGQTDVFEFDAVDLGEPKKVIIGHDGKGVGSGWFLDKVVVKDKQDPEKEYIFKCQKWLDEGEDDGLLERTLDVYVQQNNWQIEVTTGQEEDAGSDADLIIVIYGDKGCSKELPLVSAKEKKFSPGETEQFEVLVEEELGDIYKVRVGYAAEADLKQNLLLDKVKLKSLEDEKEYEFECKQRMPRTDDSEGWREIPLKKEKPEDMLPVLTYRVSVATGDKFGSGTDANVYLTIYGERGDTGKRKLLKSITYGWDKFEADHTDLFDLEAVNLGALTKVVVGHDGEGSGSGWFLDKIIIKEAMNEDAVEYTFLCNRWLDEGEDDGKIERELPVKPLGEPWKIWTTTGKGNAAGTTNDAISLTIYGDKAMSEPVVFADEAAFSFKPGQTQDFDVFVKPQGEAEDLGQVYKVRIGYHEPAGNPTWLLDTLKLKEEKSGKEYEFELKDWVSLTDSMDGWREIPLQQKNKKDMLPVHKYQVEVVTGDKSGAGTDADVFIQLFGERGDTGKRKLLKAKDKNNKFEAGQTDLFELEAVDLKKVTKVTIGHNGSGAGSGWFLDQVNVKESPKATQVYQFPCKRWLDEGEDDGKIVRDLELDEDGDGEAGDWKVQVSTGDKENAGTNAKVTLTVFGDKGDSGPLPLGEPGNGLFEKGATDEFEIFIDPKDVGRMEKIRIEHDGKKPEDGWYLEKIVMKDLLRKDKLEIPVNRWLHVEEEDGDTVRELPIVYPGEDPKDQPVPYIVQTVTGKESGGGTDASVYMILQGEKGNSGKRFLRKSKEGKDMFEKGKTDTFTVEAVGLGDLQKVTIGHDESGSGAGWYLEKVIIKETEDAKEQYVFPCDGWIGKDEEGQQSEKELTGKKEPVAPPDDGKKSPSKGKKK